MSSKRILIDDTIKAVARARLNIREEECYQWFEDASRLADKISASLSAKNHWEAGT